MGTFTKKRDYSVIGKEIPRVDSLVKVKGKAKFVADFDMKDMLYGALVLSKRARGRVKKIDVSKASSLKGVRAILTYEDIPGENQIGEVVNDMPCLVPVGEEVRYYGDVISLVAADSLEIAKEAVKLVKVEYEDLEPVLTIEKALKNEVKIHPSGNILTSKKIRKGNVEKGFFESDFVIEDDFYAHYQEQAYLEPQGILSLYDNNYGITIYGSMQCPYYVQEMVPKVLGMSMHSVRVIQAETGGAFGGKEDVPSYVASQCALLTYHTKKPVLLVYSREVDIQTTSKRHPIKSHYKLGVTEDGKIKAVEITAHMDMGAYATLSPIVMYRSLVHAAGAYDIENVKVDIDGVYTNKVPCGAFRGFGSPQVLFAMESIVDEAAEKLRMDPMDIRLKNALRIGSRTSTDQLLTESVGAVKTIEHAMEISNYAELKKEMAAFNLENKFKKRGIGVSHIIYGISLGAAGQHLDAAGSLVQVHRDGSVNIHIGNTEMGQGAKTVIAMIASEALGQSIEKIRVDNPDTSYVQDSGPTVASRATVFSGNAVKKACEKIKARMEEYFSKTRNVSVEEIVFKNGAIKTVDNKHKILFDSLANECYNSNTKMVERGWFVSPKLRWNSETGLGEAYITYAYATQVVVAEVDMLTGKSQVIEAYTSHDVGKKLNPVGLVGQVQGGFVQGMGYGLFEDIKTTDGRITTDNFNTYIIPTISDIPQKLKIDFVEDAYSQGPFGAKGIGEPSLMPVPASIANAISNAVRKRVKRIPATAEYVFNIIEEVIK